MAEQQGREGCVWGGEITLFLDSGKRSTDVPDLLEHEICIGGKKQQKKVSPSIYPISPPPSYSSVHASLSLFFFLPPPLGEITVCELRLRDTSCSL